MLKRWLPMDPQRLQTQTLVAAIWSFVGSTGRGGIRLLSNLLLTRLLLPEHFGLMATATVVVTLIQVFSDTGVRTALIQNPRGHEPEFINTSFFISMGRNLLLTGLLLVLKGPAARYYQLPELETILGILSLAILVEGLVNPALPRLTRELNIKKQVLYAVGSQFLGFLVTLALAWSLRTVTALAYGYVATSMARVILSYVVYPFTPSLRWDTAAGKALFHFGKVILVNTMITWAALNVDRLIVGKVLGMEALGLYNLALYLGVFASDILVQVFAQSYFPAMSRIAQDRERVWHIYGKTTRATLWIALPVLLGLALVSQPLVNLLYDPRYALAGSVLFWIALRSMVQVLNHIQSGTLLALGKPMLVTLPNLVGLAFLLAILAPFSTRWSLTGSAIALLISMVVMTLGQTWLLLKKEHFPAMVVLKPWLILGLMLAVALPLGMGFTFFLTQILEPGQRLVALPLSAAVMAMIIWIQFPRVKSWLQTEVLA